MNVQLRSYLFGVIFLAVGLFQVYQKDYLEASLYLLAGLSFIANTLTSEPKLATAKKALVVITWILIITTALVFLYVLQFKYL
ncbi:MAG TPA: hypothetical protein VGK59_16905 [Ohtaekwangia sp.]